MKKLVVFTLLIFSLFSYTAAQKSQAARNRYEKKLKIMGIYLGREIARAEKKTIAVATFTDEKGNPTEVGKVLANDFTVFLVKEGKRYETADQGFTVIDRGMSKAYPIIENKSFNIKAIKKIRKDLKVDGIVLGSLRVKKRYVQITLRVLNPKNGKIIYALKRKIRINRRLKKAIDKKVTVREDIKTRRDEPLRPNNKKQRLIREDVEFLLQHCKREGETVLCTITATSLKKDKNIRFYLHFNHHKYSQIFTDDGSAFKAKDLKIGGKYRNGGMASMERKFVRGLTTPILVIFKKVPETNKQIKLLNLFMGMERKHFLAFRNITIQ